MQFMRARCINFNVENFHTLTHEHTNTYTHIQQDLPICVYSVRVYQKAPNKVLKMRRQHIRFVRSLYVCVHCMFQKIIFIDGEVMVCHGFDETKTTQNGNTVIFHLCLSNALNVPSLLHSHVEFFRCCCFSSTQHIETINFKWKQQKCVQCMRAVARFLSNFIFLF